MSESLSFLCPGKEGKNYVYWIIFLLAWILGILFVLAAIAMNNEWFAGTALADYFVRNLTMQTVDYIVGGVFLLLGLVMVGTKFTICKTA